ncbi:hypothetical protein GC093_24200 [Paenibacillus sp. LMG 31456]|uniref:Uncharacterized protein n=1 Tax=Paenibacillus foliorum TaxID=2654974 RepID=A0A972H0G3_9BACL|nr:hypothetical protein [Paenibacillus foliorum]NOU96300.1 hypothetical protein [Paenibacillus foliorum]
MARLEYRLHHDPSELICHYDGIPLEELLIRNVSDWFIRGGTIYEKQSTEKQDSLHLIYVTPSDQMAEQTIPAIDNAEALVVEIRQFEEELSDYPLLRLQHCDSLLDVLLLIQTETITLDGQKWAKSSFELDEDRKMFIYYARRIK